MTNKQKTTQTTTSQSSGSQTYDPFVGAASRSALARATELSNRKYTPYTGQRIAGMSVNEQQAGALARTGYDDARRMITEGTSAVEGGGTNAFLGEGADLVRGSATNQYGDEAAAAFRAGAGNYGDSQQMINASTRGFNDAFKSGDIDPYMRNIADPMERRANEDYEAQRQAQNAQLAMSGAFGGSGQVLADSQLRSRYDANLQDIRGAAFDRAIGVYSDDQNRKLAGGQALGSIAAQEAADRRASGGALAALGDSDRSAKYNAGTALTAMGEQDAMRKIGVGQTKIQAGNTLAGMNSQQVQDLMATGGIERVLQQANLDFDYGQFLEKRDWDVNNLAPLLNTLQAIPKDVYQNMTSKQVAEEVTKSGGAGQVLGLAATVAGAFFTGGASLAVGAGATAAGAGAGAGGKSMSPSMLAATPNATSWSGAFGNFGDQLYKGNALAAR